MTVTLDCGDNSCEFATQRGGMRTNGGCRCLEGLSFTQRLAVGNYLYALHEATSTAITERDAMKRVVEAARECDDVHAPGCSYPFRPDLPCTCGRVELTEALRALDGGKWK
jgi:hypothetical protein